MDVYVDLTEDALDPIKLIEFVKSPKAGAIVYFGGVTRDNMDGKPVSHLAYEAYTPLALKTLEAIARQALDKWKGQLFKVAIVHRLGTVPVQQESVIIAVSAAHRQEGWRAGEWILEAVKASAEIWKNETFEDGSSLWKANDGDKPNNQFISR